MTISSIAIAGYGLRPLREAHQSRRCFRSWPRPVPVRWLPPACRSSDVDGLAICSFELPPDNAVTTAEQFGLSVSWAYYGTAGSAGPVASVINAGRAIETGHASTVLCIAGDNYDIGGHFKLMDNFSRGLRNYGTPLGFGGPTVCLASSSASIRRPTARAGRSSAASRSTSAAARSTTTTHCCAAR